MVASAVDDFLTEFRTDLAARAGLAGVTITTRPLGPEDQPLGAIQLARIEDWNQEPLAMGGSRRETFTIVGTITAKGAGKSESAWSAIRTTLFALLAEIEGQCEDYVTTLPANAVDVEFGGADLDTVLIEGDPAYDCQFRVDVEAHLT